MKTKLITIYLPQFHEIEENNKWWGEGFTEWTNVKRGRPFYPGHYQPRIPYNKQYYDLNDGGVLDEHAKLASKSGIYGFAFYHYYFCGKKLLEKPIERYRDESVIDFPYCLIWANQSWTRTWYRADAGKSVLLEQRYGTAADWIEQYQYLQKFFFDSRYIKVENKPVYLIYLPQDIKERKEMFELWNELAIRDGFDGIYLIAMNTGWGVDYTYNLYDAYMNFEPMHTMFCDITFKSLMQSWKAEHIGKIKEKSTFANYIYAQNIYSYRYLCKKIENGRGMASNTKTMYGIFSGWDNTSRKDEAGIIVRNSSPHRFGKHLKKMLELSEKKGNEFLFLNAWNEWSEGAYIEPDEKYGYAYLKELKRSVDSYERES